MLNEAELNLARHALGLSNPKSKGKSYRNRYISGMRIEDFDRMVARDLAEYNRGVYWLTRKGAELALLDGETLCHEDFPT